MGKCVQKKTVCPSDISVVDKRKSISDLSDAGSSSFSPEREKPSASVSVRAMSALYLSKVAAAESTVSTPSLAPLRCVSLALGLEVLQYFIYEL